MNNNSDIVVKTIEEVADIPAEEITEDSAMIDDLDLSSLELMSIINEVSRKCSVKISNKQMLEIETVRDLVELLNAAGK